MENCKRMWELFKEMLDLHINTKTTDTVFHKESLSFYENLFNSYHDTLEAMTDSWQMEWIDWAWARKRAYEILTEAKSIMEEMVWWNKDMAVDNVLRWLIEKIWFQCWTSKGLLSWSVPSPKKEESEELEEPENESTEEESEEESEEEINEEESVDSEDESNTDDLMWEDMEDSKSWYTYSKKSDSDKEEEVKKKRRGSTEYTVVSIMP